MRFSTRLKTGISTIVLCCTVATATSCSLGPNDLPLFQSGDASGYEVTLQFSSVMNLPAGAYVMMDGLKVGEVRSVDVSDKAVLATAQIDNDTRVPANVRAVIRQNTLLGDTYVALDRDLSTSATDYLEPGGVVPVERTTSPPQLEDTIAVLATFVNGGSIQKIEDAMGGINTVMPPIADVRRLASTVAVDMHDLGQNTDEIDRALAGLDSTAMSINEKSDAVSAMLTPSAMHYWRRMAVSMISYMSILLPTIGSVFEGGMWMVPMLNSLDNSAGMIRTSWDKAPSDAEKLSNFLRTTIVPFVQSPSVNIRSINSPQGDQRITDVEALLRMLGAVK